MAAWRKLSAVSSFLYRFPRKLIFSSKVIGQPLFVAVYQIIWCTSNQERLQVQGGSLPSTSSPTLLRHSIFPRRNQMKNGSECCQIFHHYCTWLLDLLPLQHKKLIAAQTIQALRKKTIPTKQQHRPPTSRNIRGAGGKFVKSTRQLQKNALQCSDDKRRRGFLLWNAKRKLDLQTPEEDEPLPKMRSRITEAIVKFMFTKSKNRMR